MWITSLLSDLNNKFINGSFAFSPSYVYYLSKYKEMQRNLVRGGSRIFFRSGCTRLLLYFNTNKPHSFFLCKIPVVLENRRSSQEWGGGVRTPCTLPLDPPLRFGKVSTLSAL